MNRLLHLGWLSPSTSLVRTGLWGFLTFSTIRSFWGHLHPEWYVTMHLSSWFVTDTVTAAPIRIITSIENTHTTTQISQSRVVILFCYVHRNDNEICIVLLFHALFCLVLCVPAVTWQVATHCPLLVGKQHCFTETLGLCGCCCPLCHCPARNTMCRSLSRREGLFLMGL